MSMMRASILVCVAGLGGCVADELGESTVTAEAGSRCPDFACGENSPVPGPFRLPEFNTKGLPNTFGIIYKEFRVGGQLYDLAAINDRLVGYYPGTTTIAVQHQALAGGQIVFAHPGEPDSGLSPGTFTVTINHVTAVGQTFWVAPYTPVETYELLYEGASATPRTPLCKRPPTEDLDEEGRIIINRFESIFFTGDRYNSQTKTVFSSTPVLAPRVFANWINVACAGSVTAKLHLNRHTTASQATAATGYSTTHAQRQAMLKMYAGDFCGSGNSYTVAGTPIHWENGLGQHSPYVNQKSWESLWDSHGAKCLDLHRLSSSTDPDLRELGKLVLQECPTLPKCNLSALPPLGLTSPYVVTQSAAY